ncbi:hypothetical protein D6817_04315 [Candidatus Pacearchaeota archaeon]|nr:MAG: hypothetical protein D6817_04315 [Candidatus Pacearchaeota archaeon]
MARFRVGGRLPKNIACGSSGEHKVSPETWLSEEELAEGGQKLELKLDSSGRPLTQEEKDEKFRELLTQGLEQIGYENPRTKAPTSARVFLQPDADHSLLFEAARDSRVAFILSNVALKGARGITRQARGDMKLSQGEGELIAALAPQSQSPTVFERYRPFFPDPEHEGEKYVLLLRNMKITDPEIMELALFLAPWYGLTSHSKGGLQAEILKQARRVLSYHSINLEPFTQDVFTLDDLVGFGHALAISRQTFERHRQDTLRYNEHLLTTLHFFQNYDISGIHRFVTKRPDLGLTIEPDLGLSIEDALNGNNASGQQELEMTFEAFMIKILPYILHQEVLYRDAALHYLAGLQPEDLQDAIKGNREESVITGTERVLRTNRSLRGLVVVEDQLRESVKQTLHALSSFYKAVRSAKNIYQAETPDDRLMVSEAQPILRVYGQYLLGFPFQDTFGPSGSRASNSSESVGNILPALYTKLFDLA